MHITSLENDIVEIPYEYISSLEDRILIEKLFKELKKGESEIILLHLLKGFTFKEISEIMDKPLGSVLSQYYRGMKKLKKGSGI
jgi:RNA polymerase sigma-70 factor (ECF subfamily)